MFNHNLGDGNVYTENPATVEEEALKIAGWDINDGFTVDDIFMNNNIKFDQHKKWKLYGYSATRYYVGLDVGKNFINRDFFTDYTENPSTVMNTKYNIIFNMFKLRQLSCDISSSLHF